MQHFLPRSTCPYYVFTPKTSKEKDYFCSDMRGKLEPVRVCRSPQGLGVGASGAAHLPGTAQHAQESKIKNQESRIENQESRIKNGIIMSSFYLRKAFSTTVHHLRASTSPAASSEAAVAKDILAALHAEEEADMPIVHGTLEQPV